MKSSIFNGKTIEEAISKVKRALGPDAMILSTKKINNGKDDGYFQVEAMYPEQNSSNDLYNSGDLRSEIMSIKEMLKIRDYMNGFFERIILEHDLYNIYIKLLKQGLDLSLIKKILNDVINQENIDKREIKKEIIYKIMNNIITINPFERVKKERIISAMIGTTGVGKTTTIAKLSAKLLLNLQIKIGIISLDTYRIGAMDQLKKYTDIMGLPFYQAYKKRDLVIALNKLKDKDLIMIDTAGLSHYDNRRIEEMKRVFDNSINISTHLLISAATNETEIMTISNRFQDLNYISLIFTKVDETRCFGPMTNHLLKSGSPISYFTTGQRVPDDIENATANKIVNLLIN